MRFYFGLIKITESGQCDCPQRIPLNGKIRGRKIGRQWTLQQCKSLRALPLLNADVGFEETELPFPRGIVACEACRGLGRCAL